MLDQKRDFFISLNSADKEWGDWVVYQLKRKKYTVYYQFEDFPPGADFMSLMNIALANTKATIAIWTKRYFESKFASLEGRVALKQSLAKEPDEGARLPRSRAEEFGRSSKAGDTGLERRNREAHEDDDLRHGPPHPVLGLLGAGDH